MLALVSRADARSQGLLRYFTGQPCRHGHIAERETAKSDCIECSRLRKAAFCKTNAEKGNARSRAWYAANKEKAKATRADWRQRHAEKDRADVAAYQATHKERIKAARLVWEVENVDRIKVRRAAYRVENAERVRAVERAWAKQNRDKGQAKEMKRVAAKLRAMPSWADHEKIKAIYAEAVRLTAETGIPHEVDHIYPLRSKWCCGLHVENNLQILTASANRAKSNRRPDGVPAFGEGATL